jgi:hypothetical protein
MHGIGNGASPGATEPNTESAYADEAGGDTAIVCRGWPYTTGAAGSPALRPGNTYGSDTSFAAGNGPKHQPRFAGQQRPSRCAALRQSWSRRGW